MALLYDLSFKVYRLVSRGVLSHLPAPLRGRIFTVIYRTARQIFPHRVRSDSTALDNLNLCVPARGKPLPSWAIAEMDSLADIEPTLHPHYPWLSASACWDTPGYALPGKIYRETLRPLLAQSPKHIIFVPWLKHGGADLAALHWAEAITAYAPQELLLVISTENAASPWRSRLPKNAIFVSLGQAVASLSLKEASQVLARFIIQAAPHTLHIINSHLAWETVIRHGTAMKNKTKLYASVYCDDFGETPVPRGYGRTALPRAWEHLTQVFSDNSSYPQLLHRDLGIPSELFTTLYLPAPSSHKQPNISSTPRILWASRLDHQKRPDILAAVAQHCPDVEFHVYGSPAPSRLIRGTMRKLHQLRNVKLLGKFESFAQICAAGYAAFLYTSSWDGLPNVLLEAGAAGLPIIAPDIGGIADLIQQETGFLVRLTEDPSQYAQAIKTVLAQPEEARQRAVNLQALLVRRHTPEQFHNRVAEALGSVETCTS